MLLLLLIALSQDPPAPPEPARSFHGHVYNMLTGEPLQGATVSFDARSAKTDEQGAFVFLGLERRVYVVHCEKDGFAFPDRAEKLVRLESDQVNVDFRLWPSSTIVGTVTDVQGKPLPGVTVQAIQKTYFLAAYLSLSAPYSAETDSQGRFRIPRLPPGRFYVRADLGARGYPTVYFPGASHLTDAQVVRIAPGSEYGGFHFTLREAPAFKASGKVVDSQTGQPVVHEVRLAKKTAKSEADGTFHFDGLFPGRYWAIVSRREGEMTLETILPFEVLNQDVKDLVLELGPGMTVRGTVRAEYSNQKLSVTIMGQSMSWNGLVADDGTFDTEAALYPGLYHFAVDAHETPANFFVSQILEGNRDVTETGIDIPPGNGVIEVTAILDYHAGAVTGNVLDPDGHPMPNARVALVSTDPHKRANPRHFKSARADSAGAFRITGVIPGDYLAVPSASDPAEVVDPEIFAQIEKHATTITVERSGIVNVDLRLTKEIREILTAY